LVSLQPFEDVVDLSKAEASANVRAPSLHDEDDGFDEPNNPFIGAATKQSFWKTGITSSTGRVFTLQLTAIITVAAVSLIVLAVGMFSLGRRLRQESEGGHGGAQVNIKHGGQVEIHNMPLPQNKRDEESGFVAAFLKTFKSKDDDSTIQTRPSMKSTKSAHSLMKSSLLPPRPMQSIERTVEATQKQIALAASDSIHTVENITAKTAHDFTECGDRMFQCASQMLCLPNDVNASCASRRNILQGESRGQGRGSDRSRSSKSSTRSSGRRHRSSSRRDTREYDEGSTYEDV